MLNDYKGLTHLKSMDIEQLRKLSDELREEIISCVSKNGGHLASSLGAVDIAIALHYVFNSPYDKIIWMLVTKLMHTNYLQGEIFLF